MREYQAILKREHVLREVYGINFLELKVLVDISGSYEWHDYKVLRRNTGLKDKNGKEIFENDIVKDMRDQSIGGVFWNGSWMKWDIGAEGNWAEDALYVATYITIIGNIHQNPELLK